MNVISTFKYGARAYRWGLYLGAGTLLELSANPQKSKLAPVPSESFEVTESSGLLTQNAYWDAMQKFLRPGDVIIAEDGTSIIGAGELHLPQGCTFVSQAVWLSSVVNRDGSALSLTPTAKPVVALRSPPRS